MPYPQYRVEKTRSVQKKVPLFGDLTLEDACSFASALNLGAVGKSEFSWNYRDDYEYADNDYCVTDRGVEYV